MKLPKLVLDSFRRNCHAKIKKIEAFIAEHEDIDLTSAKLEKLKRLNTALKEQWGRMEAAWYKHNPMVSNEDAEVLMELDEIVTALERAVGGVLEASKRFIKERLAKPFPEFLPTIRVWMLVRDSRRMSYETAAILNQNLPYISHIIG